VRRTRHLQNAKDSKGKIINIKGITPPGVRLLKEFKRMRVSQKKAAAILAMPASNINDIIRGVRPISVLIALRLEKAFGFDPAYWLNLQISYNMVLAKHDAGFQKKLARISTVSKS
jgi:antitoxin HigA-1